MKIFKRVSLFMLALVMAILPVACSGAGEKGETSRPSVENSSPSQNTPTITGLTLGGYNTTFDLLSNVNTNGLTVTASYSDSSSKVLSSSEYKTFIEYYSKTQAKVTVMALNGGVSESYLVNLTEENNTPSSAPTITGLTLSGYATSFDLLSSVNTNGLTVTATYSDSSSKALSSSEYKTFIEYYSQTQAKVTVIATANGVTKDYLVTLTGNACNHNYLVESSQEPTIQADGTTTYKCSACSDKLTVSIPKLNSTNYTIQKIKATCQTEGMDMYVSDIYGTYTVKTSDKAMHTTYGGRCDECGNGINNLYFDQANAVQVFAGGGYPRLIELMDGTFLCGFDTGHKIELVRSTDKGKTWTKTTDVVVDYTSSNIATANVALFQLDKDTILCAYRMIGTTGQTSQKYVRRLECRISKDNGYTWSHHSVITDAYSINKKNSTDVYSVSTVDNAITNEDRLGFFEPHFGIINGKLTVMYADDLTTMLENPRKNQTLNYETQYIISKQWDGSKWSNYNIVLDGTKQKTVGGIYDYSRDGMPVFDQLSDGTYVLAVEGTYRRTPERGDNPFIILLSYSKDGVNWSTPVEAYIPHYAGRKASAPYVCVTKDDRLVISFQTDEDASRAGDTVSIMKTIISDGTPIDQITGAWNFYEAQNVFQSPMDSVASWNGMMLKGDTLYCVTGTNFPWGNGGIYMQSTKIPERNAVGGYVVGESASSIVTARNGSVVKSGNYLVTKGLDNLITKNDGNIYNGTISVNIMPKAGKGGQKNNDCGLVFRVSSSLTSFWEANSNYYFLFLNWEGRVILSKFTNGAYSECCQRDTFLGFYDPGQSYSMSVTINGNVINCYVNGISVMRYVDSNPLQGTGFGVRSGTPGTWFYNLQGQSA